MSSSLARKGIEAAYWTTQKKGRYSLLRAGVEVGVGAGRLEDDETLLVFQQGQAGLDMKATDRSQMRVGGRSRQVATGADRNETD